MTLLGQLAVLAIEVVLSKLLQPHTKRARSPELDVPSTEDGTPIVQGYGTFAVSPIVAWWGHNKPAEAPNGNTFYNANQITPLCLGPIDKLVDIQCGGKSLRLHPVVKSDSTGDDATATLTPDLNPNGYTFTSDSVDIVIQARQMFGGKAREGGLEGTIRFHRGSMTDVVDPMTTLTHGADQASAWPGICYAVIGTAQVPAFYLGTVAQPKPFVFILQLIPNALGLGAIGQDANPAELLWDLHTHGLRGAGASESLFDRQSFIDGGQVFLAEGLGLSPTWSTETELQDMIDDVQNHARCYVYEHPETGLRTLKVLRAQGLTGVPVVDRSVAADLEVTWPSWRQTTNEVKVTYRKFDTTPLLQQTVTNEPLTPSSGLAFAAGSAIYQCNGRDISLITVHNVTKSADVASSNYAVNTNSGAFLFRPIAGVLDAGDVLTVSYTNGSDLVGYLDDTKVAQDLANIQRSREVRTQTYECPFFTRELPAQTHANYLLKIGGNLARATWTQTRTGHAQYPGDVVPLSWAPLDQDGNPDLVLVEKPFRITKVTAMAETDALKFEAIEDVFGMDILPAMPSAAVTSTSAPPVCPSMGIGCGIGGSNVRITLWASDTNFTIRLWQADDSSGTNRVQVGDYAGTTTYYDTATTGKYYQAQLVRTGWDDGPLTPYITCAASGGSAEAPTCVLPTYTSLADLLAGTITLTLTDDQNRVALVEFRHRSGTGTYTDWAVATGTDNVFSDTVVLAGTTSRIEWRITYLDCSGNEDAQLTGSQEFLTDPFPEADPAAPGGTAGGGAPCVEVAFHAASDHDGGVMAYPSALEEIFERARKWFDASSFTRCRAIGKVRGALAGATVGFRYTTDPTETGFEFFDGAAGPYLPLDATGTLRSPWVALPAAARADILLQCVGRLGDGATTVRFGHLAIEFDATPVPDPATADNPGPQPINSDCGNAALPVAEGLFAWHLATCGITIGGGTSGVAASDALSYASQALAEAASWVITNTTGDITITFGVSHTTGGFTTSVRFHIGAGSTSGTARLQKSYNLTPNSPYTVTLKVDCHGGAFESINLRCVSGGTTVSDGAAGDTGQRTLTCVITTDGTGVLQVNVEKDGGFPYLHNDDYYVAGLVIEGATAVGVATWQDQTENGNDLTETGSDPKPTSDGTVVDATGGALLQYASGVFDDAESVELFAVLTADADPGGADTGLLVAGTSGTPSEYPDSSGHIIDDFGSSTSHDVGDPTPDLTDVHLYHVRSRLGEWVAELDGVQVYRNTTNTVAMPSVVQVGGGVILRELVIYKNRVLSQLEVDLTTEALNARHSIGLTSPVNSTNSGGSGGSGGGAAPGPIPAPTVPAGGRPFLLYNVRASEISAGYVPPFNGSIIHQGPSDIIAFLDALRAVEGRLLLIPYGRAAVTAPGGGLNWSAMIASMDALEAVGLDSYQDVITGAMAIDEPQCASCWGGRSIPWATVDALCHEVRVRWSWMLPVVRVSAYKLQQSGYRFSYVGASANQYSGPTHQINSDGGPFPTWLARQQAAGAAIGLPAFWGINPLNGGSGTSGLPGTGAGLWRMSAGEIRAYGLPLARLPGNQSYGMYAWASGPPPSSYLLTADINAALTDVATALALVP